MIEKSRLYLGLADRKDKSTNYKLINRNGHKKLIMTLGVKVKVGERFNMRG